MAVTVEFQGSGNVIEIQESDRVVTLQDNTTTIEIASTLVASGNYATEAELQAHIDDASAAHAASAISNTPSGNLAATDVQTALDELQTDVDGRAASSHTHATTDVISGTFADARIAESNVTQHEAALSITESQISDFGSYAASSHTHATTDVTSGTFADARIAESNVTQHEAALSITESQISDLGSYEPALGNPGTDGYVLSSTTGGTRSWVEMTGGGGGGDLGDLDDVTITSIASGELLKWNGSAWINQTLAEANIVPATGGTFSGAVTFSDDLSVTGAFTVDSGTKNATIGTKATYTESNGSFRLNASSGQGFQLSNNSAYAVDNSSGQSIQLMRVTAQNHLFFGPIVFTNTISNTYLNGRQKIVFQVGNVADTGYDEAMVIEDDNGGVGITDDLRVGGDIDAGGIIDYTGTMGNSTLDPTTDAPADWVEIAIGGTTYYLPAYAAS